MNDNKIPSRKIPSRKIPSRKIPSRKIPSRKQRNDFFSKSDVKVEKMVTKDYEGWKIIVNGTSSGFVKFKPKIDGIFKKYVTVDFLIPKAKRGKHIGRIALAKAIKSSIHSIFVAHLRKSNIASKKALISVGFVQHDYPGNKQLCMVFKK